MDYLFYLYTLIKKQDIMTIEQFFKNPLEGIQPISLEIQVRQLSFGFQALKFINYPYGYKFEKKELFIYLLNQEINNII